MIDEDYGTEDLHMVLITVLTLFIFGIVGLVNI